MGISNFFGEAPKRMRDNIAKFSRTMNLKNFSDVVIDSVATIVATPFFLAGNLLKAALGILAYPFNFVMGQDIVGWLSASEDIFNIGKNIGNFAIAAVALVSTPATLPFAAIGSAIGVGDKENKVDKSAIKTTVTKQKNLHVNFAENAQVLDFFKEEAPEEINNNPKLTLRPIKAYALTEGRQETKTL